MFDLFLTSQVIRKNIFPPQETKKNTITGQRQRFKMLMCIKIALFPIINQNLHAETNDSLASPLHWWFTCGVCDFKQQNKRFSCTLTVQTWRWSALRMLFEFFLLTLKLSLPWNKANLFHLLTDFYQNVISYSSVWVQGQFILADALKGNKKLYFIDYIFLSLWW